MNDAQIRARLSAGTPGKFNVDRGLYFRVTKEGSGFWIYRYTINGRRREYTIGRYGKSPGELSLASARSTAAHLRADVQNGVDPIVEKNRSPLVKINTVNQVANDWLGECRRRLENPHIPERIYRKDISIKIGDLTIDRVNPQDILGILREINASGRPTIANDALGYCKQIFNHAVKLGLIKHNPAMAFTTRDAGGFERPRNRVLTLSELTIVFRVFRENHQSFTRENYLAIALLTTLGVRKKELISAQWTEFDLEQGIWTLAPERTKTNRGIKIPIPSLIKPWLDELAIRANGSAYLFPARRASKRRPYISDDTLNHALARLFGKQYRKTILPNVLGDAGVDHFVIHDLRRTCRSLLASNGVPPHIAERCLNHKISGVQGVYDCHDYFEERRKALSQVAQHIVSIAGIKMAN